MAEIIGADLVLRSRGRLIGVAIAIALALLGFTNALLTSGGSVPRVAFATSGVLFVALAVRFADVRLELDQQGVVIHREIRTTAIPWRDVVEFRVSESKSWVLCADAAGHAYKALYWSQ